MTAVVAVNTLMNGVALVADTRLTTVAPSGQVLRLRDVCQKLIIATPWCVVGFAGNSLCLARTFLSGVIKRVRDYPTDSLSFMTDGSIDWLRNDQQLADYLAQGYAYHASIGPDHAGCVNRGTELLIAWLNVQPAVPGSVPAANPEIIAARLPGAHVPHIGISRKSWGIHVIGRGAIAAPAIDTPEMFTSFANITDGAEAGNATQTMFVAEVLRNEMAAQGEATVGGLYQLVHLSHHGVMSFPYFYRASVAPGYGTYVAMRLDNGLWVQEHRPSGTIRPVLSPFDAALIGRHGDVIPQTHEMFEPSEFLTATSDGVLPNEDLTMLYVQYDPAHVPPEVVASWGPEPVPPSTGHGAPAPTSATV